METKWNRRDILKAGATGAAYSLLGTSLAARAQGKEAPMLILRNGKITTLAAAAAAVAGPGCAVHGQQRQLAWFSDIPAADQGEFWSAFGCSCWMA